MSSTRPVRGRGRPATFGDALRARFLDAVRSGMRLGEAADHVGVHRNIPTRTARTDTVFGKALDEAKAEGREARVAGVPHGEARYNNYGCRCAECTAAASKARAGRREVPQPVPNGGKSGQVVDLQMGAESPVPLSLRIAS